MAAPRDWTPDRRSSQALRPPPGLSVVDRLVSYPRAVVLATECAGSPILTSYRQDH